MLCFLFFSSHRVLCEIQRLLGDGHAVLLCASFRVHFLLCVLVALFSAADAWSPPVHMQALDQRLLFPCQSGGVTVVVT